jgi:glutathione synthase/RimK-type ligase-like ATP-grasp enzyme
MRCVVVGIPGGRRVELFQAALAQRGWDPAVVVPWRDVVQGRADLRRIVRAGDVVRLDSPGRDWETERALLAAGGLEGAEQLAFDKGRIYWPRVWYSGFCHALERIGRQLAECADHVAMNDPREVAVMFDKAACHARLSAAHVRVPPALGEVGSFDELRSKMRGARWQRVFVKLAHGSSASGVVAYQTNGRQHQATTTVERVRQSGELRLYNSRRIRTHRDPRDIEELIDELCRHGVHVERWLPKAGIDGQAFDLRVVVIGGFARHVVMRMSRSPMTNLHLLNERGEASRVREMIGEPAWAAAMSECERAMACFPGSLHGGVDLLIGAAGRGHAVLEVNAFGDLLPGILWEGMDTYAAQIEQVARRGDRAPADNIGGKPACVAHLKAEGSMQRVEGGVA